MAVLGVLFGRDDVVPAAPQFRGKDRGVRERLLRQMCLRLGLVPIGDDALRRQAEETGGCDQVVEEELHMREVSKCRS